jgi:quinol monooxygenase YgiN
MIHITALITAEPGKRQDILNVVLPLVPGIREEPGCVEYTVTIDADVVGTMHKPTPYGPDTYVVVERWETLADLERHSELPVVAEFFEKIAPLMKSRVVHFLVPAE